VALHHRSRRRLLRAGCDVRARQLRLGCNPVTAQIGGTGWRTSLFPKDGRYIVPVKAWVRKAEGLDVGDTVTVHLVVDV
jgi:Domain of unknown function (DUF1905)